LFKKKEPGGGQTSPSAVFKGKSGLGSLRGRGGGFLAKKKSPANEFRSNNKKTKQTKKKKKKKKKTKKKKKKTPQREIPHRYRLPHAIPLNIRHGGREKKKKQYGQHNKLSYNGRQNNETKPIGGGERKG